MKNIDQQIQEELKRLRDTAVLVDDSEGDVKVTWTARTKHDNYERNDQGAIVRPKDHQIYADLQLSRGAARPINADFEWTFTDPAEHAQRYAKRNQARLEHFLRCVSLKKSSRIIDIGARTGQLLYFLRERGYSNLAGVDVVKLNVLWCQKNGFDVSLADAHELSSVTGTSRFDAVFAYHVLEHCYDPIKVLKEFYSVLVDDGAVHIEVPFGPIDLSKAHVYRFRKGDLRQLLESVGFVVYQSQGEKHELIVAGKKPLSLWKRVQLRLT